MSKKLYYYPRVTCPYCGNKFKVRIKAKGYYQPITVYCDIDDNPGCDKLFVVKVDVEVKVDSLKIEGEE